MRPEYGLIVLRGILFCFAVSDEKKVFFAEIFRRDLNNKFWTHFLSENVAVPTCTD
jgi:hypothetical protein